MKVRLFLFTACSFISQYAFSQRNTIVIEGQLNGFDSDTVRLFTYSPYKTADYHVNSEDIDIYSVPVKNGIFKFSLKIHEPLYVKIALGNEENYGLIEPGDSLHIKQTDFGCNFSGCGSEKFEIFYKAIPLSKDASGKLNYEGLQRFLYVNRFCDSVAIVKRQMLSRFKLNMSSFAYAFIEAEILSKGEHHRTNEFRLLVENRKKYDLSADRLTAIFDSTIQKSEVISVDLNDTSILSGMASFYCLDYSGLEYERSFGFRDSILEMDMINKNIQYYSYVKNKYKGLAQRKILTTILTRYMISRKGAITQYTPLIDDYLSFKGYEVQRKFVTMDLARARKLENGQISPSFKLIDISGQEVSLSDFKGKTVFLDFWFSGCVGCIQMTNALRNVEKVFKENSNVIFLSVCVDKDKDTWLKSIEQGKYTTESAINLYTGGLGTDHPIIDAYNVTSYPKVFFIGFDGKFATDPSLDPRKDMGKSLISLINKQIVEQNDGPHIFYNENKAIVKSIVSEKNVSIIIDSTTAPRLRDSVFRVQTDIQGETFPISIKREIRNEPSEFDQPSRIFVLSDIEGNFEAFRKLLQVNKIIDSSFNWKFKDGHLVLLGDFFDRGNQVTECLWLIYSLEEKAKASGGYVHFILGNHEIMNLNGNIDYVRQKYLDYASILDVEYSKLWNKDTELGRWLRTKNIIEKIGTILFVHGGISARINQMHLSLTEINSTIKPFYDEESDIRKNDSLDLITLFRSRTSPFWYRGYYELVRESYNSNEIKKKATVEQIDSTLMKFHVNRIVTGHTIVADTISIHYNGRLLNTDTHHENGKSEALLIEASRYFRVNIEGTKKMLFDNNRVLKKIVRN